MGTGDGATAPLTVDPELLERYGNQLLTAADGLPAAPPPFTVTGTDPMSLAISDKLPAMEDGIQDQLPQLKDQASETASKIVSAAGKYQDTDQQSAADITAAHLDSAGGTSGSGGGGGAMGQMGQLMSMPMQMVGQAVQMPMQAMGAVASLPQSVMQGVQQFGQMAGGPQAPSGTTADLAEKLNDAGDDPQRDAEQGATAGAANAERAPSQSSPRHAAPEPEVNL